METISPIEGTLTLVWNEIAGSYNDQPYGLINSMAKGEKSGNIYEEQRVCEDAFGIISNHFHRHDFKGVIGSPEELLQALVEIRKEQLHIVSEDKVIE